MVSKLIKRIFHKHVWDKWEVVSMECLTIHNLERKCTKCNKKEKYNGMVETCITTGNKSPYIYKH